MYFIVRINWFRQYVASRALGYRSRETSSTFGYTKQSRQAAGMELAPQTAMRLKFRALTAGSHRGFACDDLP